MRPFQVAFCVLCLYPLSGCDPTELPDDGQDGYYDTWTHINETDDYRMDIAIGGIANEPENRVFMCMSSDADAPMLIKGLLYGNSIQWDGTYNIDVVHTLRMENGQLVFDCNVCTPTLFDRAPWSGICGSLTGGVAAVVTLPISAITANGAMSGGTILTDGGSPITQRGVCWSATPGPTIFNSSTNDGSGIGSFSSSLGALVANTTYHVRAYATTAAQTLYGNELSFTTSAGATGIVSAPGAGVNFDGHTYPSTVLGNGQEWMAENLVTSVYANGDPIPHVTDIPQWADLTSGAWASHGNNAQNDDPYGRYYNWYAVNDPRKVCPNGWHVPSDGEWSALASYLGGQNVAGGKMKGTGFQYWLSPNTDATDEIGFTALPSGYRNYQGDFYPLGSLAFWWSSDALSESTARSRGVSNYLSNLSADYSIKESGFSIRCIKD